MPNGVALHGLYQVNSVHNQNDRLLDLIFVNPSCNVSAAPDVLSVVDAHHPPVMVSLHRHLKQTFIDEFDPNAFDFHRGNYDALSTDLRITDWTPIRNCTDPNEAVEIFVQIILNKQMNIHQTLHGVMKKKKARERERERD